MPTENVVSGKRSFARRIGKSLSQSQRDLLTNQLPNYLFKTSLLNSHTNISLEIGFGMGEHLVNQAICNRERLFIGADVYLNGVANLLKLIIEHNLTNVLLWNDDIDLIIEQIPDNRLETIYLLFPDPWHKRRNLKKRFLNQERLNKLKQSMKESGSLVFASDIADYYRQVYNLLSDNGFQINDNNKPHVNYVNTKYHNKALIAGREVQFLEAILITKS